MRTTGMSRPAAAARSDSCSAGSVPSLVGLNGPTGADRGSGSGPLSAWPPPQPPRPPRSRGPARLRPRTRSGQHAPAPGAPVRLCFGGHCPRFVSSQTLNASPSALLTSCLNSRRSGDRTAGCPGGWIGRSRSAPRGAPARVDRAARAGCGHIRAQPPSAPLRPDGIQRCAAQEPRPHASPMFGDIGRTAGVLDLDHVAPAVGLRAIQIPKSVDLGQLSARD
jgi:hypothetical protein